MSSIQLWPDKEAESILKVHGADPHKTYIFETGFGPSGKPHFGTFGEVVRTNYVMLAMQQLGYQTKLIAFSDDLDGLRKVPEGFPDWVGEHLGKPVSQIPDPFDDQHPSFSAHMNALLVQMLDELNLVYEFRASSEAYQRGDFNEQIRIVIENYEQVQEIVFAYLRDETKEYWFPFLPICEACGRVGTTRVTAVDKANMLVSYACDRPFGKAQGCGSAGALSPFNGTGKLQWKVDWCSRWQAYGVHYEMFGKDLIESAEVGDAIIRKVYKGTPPVHMFYELFLDEDARKISKSKGRGMTAETWLRYGTPDSLLYLMLDKPREAKRLYEGVIPRYMELTQKAAEAYYKKDEKAARDARYYQFIHRFQPPSEPPALVDYNTLANLVGNVGLSDPAIVEDYLRRSNLIPAVLSPAQRADLHNLILKAKTYYDEQLSLETEEPQFDGIEGYLLAQLVTFLESGEHDAERIHFELFEIAKRHNVDPKKFFRAVYFALIKQERGPRGGNFIKLLGQAKAVELIKARLFATPSAENVQPQQTRPAQNGGLVALGAQARAKFKGLSFAYARLTGVSISEGRPEALASAIKQAVAPLTRQDMEARRATGPIAAYRALYEAFGANPNATPPSPENILRLAVDDKRLPNVNSLVDAANLGVLETGFSIALYDADKLAFPLTLRLAEVGETHIPIGGKYAEKVPSGELVYADADDIICRALNYRDADKSKVTTKTQNLLLIVDGAPNLNPAEVFANLQRQLERLIALGGGEVQEQGLVL
jgi:lysyl-tRNA synthetase class 1